MTNTQELPALNKTQAGLIQKISDKVGQYRSELKARMERDQRMLDYLVQGYNTDSTSSDRVAQCSAELASLIEVARMQPETLAWLNIAVIDSENMFERLFHMFDANKGFEGA